MEKTISLYELQQVIKTAIYVGTPHFYWIVAEISEININNYSGHCYLELTDNDKQGDKIKAKIRANIWNRNYININHKFEKETGIVLSPGTKVLIKGKVDYHELYGLSLTITDIDPSYTLGDMEGQRRAIIRQLEKEGVFSMNKEIDFPLLPQRIAVISSANAAGYGDFVRHLTNNPSGYHYEITLFDTVMQGDTTETAVIGSLEKIATEYVKFDLVVIIRGGGSRSDLAWFDNYGIAYYITQFPLPVLTGIGHEKDTSIADMVAYQSFKTPTATANYLTDCFDNINEHLQVKASGIVDLAGVFILNNKEHLKHLSNNILIKGKSKLSLSSSVISSMRTRLNSSTIYLFNNKKEKMVSFRKKLKDSALDHIHEKQTDLIHHGRILKHLDPVNVLNRGYTISYKDGKIVTNVASLQPMDIMETRFRDGTATSKITKTKNGSGIVK